MRHAPVHILCIETSGAVCSAAVVRDGAVLFSRVNADGQNHACMLPVFIEELLEESRIAGITLDAVALSQGPGSYTGLRIGTATAKGLCYGLNIPLIAIDTLQILCEKALSQESDVLSQKSLICPMIDARRMEVYCTLYNTQGERVTDIEAKVIDEISFADVLEQHQVYFCGDGSAKCQSVIVHENAVFIEDIIPLATQMGALVHNAYMQKKFEDVAYFDPFYLKDYIPAHSKVKGLHA